jgi:hypothetical protein
MSRRRGCDRTRDRILTKCRARRVLRWVRSHSRRARWRGTLLRISRPARYFHRRERLSRRQLRPVAFMFQVMLAQYLVTECRRESTVFRKRRRRSGLRALPFETLLRKRPSSRRLPPSTAISNDTNSHRLLEVYCRMTSVPGRNSAKLFSDEVGPQSTNNAPSLETSSDPQHHAVPEERRITLFWIARDRLQLAWSKSSDFLQLARATRLPARRAFRFDGAPTQIRRT